MRGVVRLFGNKPNKAKLCFWRS